MEILALSCALVGLIGALALIWRRLDDLANEVRLLRMTLESMRGAEPKPRPARTPELAEPLRAPAEPALVGAANAGVRLEEAPPRTPPHDPNASDDPFDESWVLKRPLATPSPALPPQAPSARAILAPQTPARPRLSGPETSRAPGRTPQRVTTARLWQGAIVAGALGVGAAIAAPALAGLAYLVAYAAFGLARAALTRRILPGAAAPALAAVAAILLIGPLGAPAFLALGVILAGAALIGGGFVALEPILVGAWAGACVALVLLHAHPEAITWFAPATAWTGALFLALASVRAPQLGARGVTVSAAGASAAIFCAATLHVAAHGLGAPWAAAGAMIAVAAALGGALILAAQPKGLAALGWAAFPLGFGAAAALMLAMFMALSAPLAASALIALAVGFLWLDARHPHRLWRFDAAVLGIGGAVMSGVAFRWVDASVAGLAALVCALPIPTALALVAAWRAAPRAPLTATGFETAALIGAAASIASLTHWACDRYGATTYAELGIIAAGWITLAALVAARADRGAWIARRLGADALLAFGIGLWALGPMSLANPLASGEDAAGAPVFNLLALGFALPALALWGQRVFWRRSPRGRAALWLAAIASLAWATLELRRAFHGATLEGPWRGDEIALYVMLWLSAGALGLWCKRWLQDPLVQQA